MAGSVSSSNLLVADFLGRLDHRQRQLQADAVTALPRFDVEPFHFAQVVGKRPQTDATGRPAIAFGVEQAAAGCRVRARQGGHLLFEMLVRQVYAEPGGVVAEKLSNMAEFLMIVGVQDA